MKTLQEYIKEGILDHTNIDRMDDDLRSLYPTPTRKDFNQGITGSWYIGWSCRGLVQPLLTKYPQAFDNKYGDINKVNGITAHITKPSGFKTYDVELKFNSANDWYYSQIFGIEEDGLKLPDAKKLVLDLFNHLQKYPNALEYLIRTCEEQIKKSEAQIKNNEISFITSINIKKILSVK